MSDTRSEAKNLPEAEKTRIAIVTIITLVLTPVSLIYNGFAVKVLWNWFAVDAGLGAIGLGSAIGIALIGALITFQTPQTYPNMDIYRTVKNVLINSYLLPSYALLIGLLIQYVF